MTDEVFVDLDTLEVLHNTIVKATGIPEEYFLGYISYKKRKMGDYLEKLIMLVEE